MKTTLQEKIKRLKTLNVNPFDSPAFKSGQLKAKNFHSYVDEMIKYVFENHLICNPK